jgi:hypothetical protein
MTEFGFHGVPMRRRRRIAQWISPKLPRKQVQGERVCAVAAYRSRRIRPRVRILLLRLVTTK